MNKPLTDLSVKLLGEDGNAFFIMGKVVKALRMAGYDADFIEEYKKKAMGGDYDNLLRVTMEYVEVI